MITKFKVNQAVLVNSRNKNPNLGGVVRVIEDRGSRVLITAGGTLWTVKSEVLSPLGK